MKIMKFSLYMLLKEKKKAVFYIISSIFSVAVMYLFINFIYNDHLKSADQIILNASNFNNIFSTMLSFLTVGIIVAMSFYAYNFYLSSQTKEIGIYLLGGSSLTRLFFYLFFQNLFIYGIALVFGVLLGYLLVPLGNYYIQSITGLSYPLFEYSPIALFGTIALTCVCIVYLAIVSLGFIHTHEIKVLLGMNGEANAEDQRVLSLPGEFYAFLFLLPIPAYIMFKDPQVSAVYSFLAVFAGFNGFCRFMVSKIIRKLQKDAFLKNKYALIISGNLNRVLSTGCSAFQLFFIISIFMNAYMASNYHNYQNRALVFIAYICLTISVCMAIVYKIMLETTQRKITFKHLHKMGYTKAEIKSMIKKEVTYLFGFNVLVALIYIGSSYLMNLLSGQLSIGFVAVNLGICITGLVIAGIFSYFSYRNAILKEEE